MKNQNFSSKISYILLLLSHENPQVLIMIISISGKNSIIIDKKILK